LHLFLKHQPEIEGKAISVSQDYLLAQNKRVQKINNLQHNNNSEQ
jgi:hypothetical protein